jgi:hypothetical protein
MKATITDSQTIDAISPVALASYLRGRGWHPGREIAGGLARTWAWTFEDAGGPRESVELVVPLDREVRDFRRRVMETLEALQTIEQRSQLDILSDIQSVSSDVIRWRWIQATAEDGTIPLEQGQEFVSLVRNQILAAACSAVEPRQFFASSKPARAVEFLRQARLGQSERGSYVITVHNPVPPAMPVSGLEDEADPFERRVTLTLSQALQSLRRAAGEAISGTRSWDERNLSREGISASLCESMANMLVAGEATRDIEVRFSFSGSRPVDGQLAPLARFSSDLSPIIGEIGRVLRETATREDFELRGFVTDLSRRPQDVNGTATIQGLVDEEYHRVEVEVGADEYNEILTPAHRDRRMIRCEGELRKVRGRTYRLQHARGFRFLREE